MIIIKYNRRALCMGDDADNGIYKIEMPDDAVLSDLINVLLKGGNGNNWPIPQTSEIGWVIYSGIGKIADISHDHKCIEYCNFNKETKLSTLDIHWVFGEREGDAPELSALARKFE